MATPNPADMRADDCAIDRVARDSYSAIGAFKGLLSPTEFVTARAVLIRTPNRSVQCISIMCAATWRTPADTWPRPLRRAGRVPKPGNPSSNRVEPLCPTTCGFVAVHDGGTVISQVNHDHPVSEGDLNPHGGEISPDRGNHVVRIQRSVLLPQKISPAISVSMLPAGGCPGPSARRPRTPNGGVLQQEADPPTLARRAAEGWRRKAVPARRHTPQPGACAQRRLPFALQRADQCTSRASARSRSPQRLPERLDQGWRT